LVWLTDLGIRNGGLTIAKLSATFSSVTSGQLTINNNSGLVLRNENNAWVTLGFNGSQLTCNYDILATFFRKLQTLPTLVL
jgi:hypothetical protein